MDSVKLDQDFGYAVKLTRLLLLPVGLWPTRSKIYQRFVRPVAVAICLLSMLSVVIPLCLLMALPAEDSKIRLTFIGPLGFSLATLLKYAMMIYQEGQVAECLWKMSLHWQQLRNDSERRVAMSSAKTGRLMIVVCAFFMCGSGIPCTSMLPLSQVSADLRSNDSLWSLTYLPYLMCSSLRVKPIDNVIFTLDCVCGLVRYTVTCGIYSIAILIIMHISSQITITNMLLDEFGVNLDCKILGRTISQHRRLLKLASRLEDTFNKIFLFEIFGSLCIIHSFGYFLFTEYENRALPTYFLLLVSFALNISMLCYIGETLTEQCGSIEEVVYRIEWYRLPQKETKNLILLIMTSQRPVYLTAGKLFNLSILTLSNVIKATATYVNILGSLIAKST